MQSLLDSTFSFLERRFGLTQVSNSKLLNYVSGLEKIIGPLINGGRTIKAYMERTIKEKEIRESQERSLTREGEGERDLGKWKMSLALCLSLVFIDDFLFGWQENLRQIEKVTASFFC